MGVLNVVKLKEGWCEMIGKALKNVSSAVTRAAKSAPKPALPAPKPAYKLPRLSAVRSLTAGMKPAPKPAYKLPPVRLPAVRSPSAGMMKKGGSVSSKHAVKVKPKGRKS
jgi:hypothetical protein